MGRPRLAVRATVLGAPDARALADFYEHLLGWERSSDREDWTVLRDPTGPGHLAFQPEPHHVPPVWPAAEGDQQMQAHLDIATDDLGAAVAWAIEGGATLADVQPQHDVRVLLDPAGHPFCLFERELGPAAG